MLWESRRHYWRFELEKGSCNWVVSWYGNARRKGGLDGLGGFGLNFQCIML